MTSRGDEKDEVRDLLLEILENFILIPSPDDKSEDANEWRDIKQRVEAALSRQPKPAEDYFSVSDVCTEHGRLNCIYPQCNKLPKPADAATSSQQVLKEARKRTEADFSFLDTSVTPKMDAIWNMYTEEGADYSYELYKEGQKLERELAEANGRLRRWAVEMNIAGVMDGADNPQHSIKKLLALSATGEPVLMEIAHIVMGFQNEDEIAHYRMLTEIEMLIEKSGDAPSQAEQPGAREDYTARYMELLYAVGNAYPGETRHRTALRYIQQAEAPGNTACAGDARSDSATKGGANG